MYLSNGFFSPLQFVDFLSDVLGKLTLVFSFSDFFRVNILCCFEFLLSGIALVLKLGFARSYYI